MQVQFIFCQLNFIVFFYILYSTTILCLFLLYFHYVGVSKLISKKTVAHHDVTLGGLAGKILKKINGFRNVILLNSGNFNATTTTLEKFDDPFSHLFIFDDVCNQGRGHGDGFMLEIFRLP